MRYLLIAMVFSACMFASCNNTEGNPAGQSIDGTSGQDRANGTIEQDMDNQDMDDTTSHGNME